MSLFRRCQRFQPLIANAYKSHLNPQLASISWIIQTRNAGGGHGHGFPRAAFDQSLVEDADLAKFPPSEIPNANEPTRFPLFIRTNLSGQRPSETIYLMWFLLVCWGYGLWYNSKWNPKGH